MERQENRVSYSKIISPAEHDGRVIADVVEKLTSYDNGYIVFDYSTKRTVIESVMWEIFNRTFDTTPGAGAAFGVDIVHRAVIPLADGGMKYRAFMRTVVRTPWSALKYWHEIDNAAYEEDGRSPVDIARYARAHCNKYGTVTGTLSTFILVTSNRAAGIEYAERLLKESFCRVNVLVICRE